LIQTGFSSVGRCGTKPNTNEGKQARNGLEQSQTSANERKRGPRQAQTRVKTKAQASANKGRDKGKGGRKRGRTTVGGDERREVGMNEGKPG
jgi:hypothetical protein